MSSNSGTAHRSLTPAISNSCFFFVFNTFIPLFYFQLYQNTIPVCFFFFFRFKAKLIPNRKVHCKLAEYNPKGLNPMMASRV